MSELDRLEAWLRHRLENAIEFLNRSVEVKVYDAAASWQSRVGVYNEVLTRVEAIKQLRGGNETSGKAS